MLFYMDYFEVGLKEWENIPVTIRKKCPECPDFRTVAVYL